MDNTAVNISFGKMIDEKYGNFAPAMIQYKDECKE